MSRRRREKITTEIEEITFAVVSVAVMLLLGVTLLVDWFEGKLVI